MNKVMQMFLGKGRYQDMHMIIHDDIGKEMISFLVKPGQGRHQKIALAEVSSGCWGWSRQVTK